MDLKEILDNKRNWVDSADESDYWRTLENAAFNLRVPYARKLYLLFIYLFIYLNTTEQVSGTIS